MVGMACAIAILFSKMEGENTTTSRTKKYNNLQTIIVLKTSIFVHTVDTSQAIPALLQGHLGWVSKMPSTAQLITLVGKNGCAPGFNIIVA